MINLIEDILIRVLDILIPNSWTHQFLLTDYKTECLILFSWQMQTRDNSFLLFMYVKMKSVFFFTSLFEWCLLLNEKKNTVLSNSIHKFIRMKTKDEIVASGIGINDNAELVCSLPCCWLSIVERSARERLRGFSMNNQID